MKYEKRIYKGFYIHLVWIADRVGWFFEYNNKQYSDFVCIEPREKMAFEALDVLFLNAKETIDKITNEN